jgi:hypothetical protein
MRVQSTNSMFDDTPEMVEIHFQDIMVICLQQMIKTTIHGEIIVHNSFHEHGGIVPVIHRISMDSGLTDNTMLLMQMEWTG